MAVDVTALLELLVDRLAPPPPPPSPAERVYTRAEVGDPTFYAANRADIHQAIREHRIATEEEQA